MLSWSDITLDTGKNQPLYLLLAARLRQMIVTGQLQPGERLPSSRQLQKLFAVSAVTCENGLALLVEEGYLCRRPRSGTYVAAVLPKTGGKIDAPRIVHAIFSYDHRMGAYWHVVIAELERHFTAAGYLFSFRSCHPSAPPPLEVAHYQTTAGIVLCGYNSLAFADDIRRAGVPVVLIGALADTPAAASDGGGHDLVVHNDRERARLSARHLLDLGHRQLACVTAPGRSQLSGLQRQGFADAFAEYGLDPAGASWLELSGTEHDDGVKAGYDILCRRNRPSALYVGNVSVALGVMATAERLGLRVPEDCSLIACGGLYFDPAPDRLALTTTESRPGEAARLAAEKLLNQVRDPEAPRGVATVRITDIRFGATTMVYRPSAAAVLPAPEPALQAASL